MTWTALTSNTTAARNTSRFVMLSTVTYQGGFVNLAPAFRSETAAGRGPSFYFTTNDPITFNTSGDPTI